MQKVIQLFEQFGKIDEEHKDFLYANLQPVQFAKGHKILKIGQVSKMIYFLERGMVKAWIYKGDDTIRTSYFMKENDIFVSVKSFFTQVPTTEMVEAYEECVALGLYYSKYKEMLVRWPGFQGIRADILERYYIASLDREDMRMKLPADRIRILMKTQPYLMDRVNVADLASYLDLSMGTYNKEMQNYLKGLK